MKNLALNTLLIEIWKGVKAGKPSGVTERENVSPAPLRGGGVFYWSCI